MKLRQSWQNTLKKTENLLSIDVRFYGKSMSLFSLAHATGVLRGLATTFFLARWLPKEAFGQFRFIIAMFAMMGFFSLSGMNSAIIRAVANGDTIVAHKAFKKILTFSPLGSLALLLVALERWFRGEVTVAYGLVIAAVAFVPYSVAGLYGAILQGEENVKKLTAYAIVNNVLFAAGFVIAIYGHVELLWIMPVYFGLDIAIRGFLTWKELGRLPKHGEVGTHLSLGKHLSLMGAFQSIVAQLDQFLLQQFGGYANLATYSIAIILPEQIKNYINSVSGLVLRRFSQYEKSEKILESTRRHFYVTIAGAAVIILVYAIAAPILVPWLFPKYEDAVPLTMVYAVGLIGISSMVGVFFAQAHNQIRQLWRYYTANSVLAFATDLLLIPIFGAWGAVFAKTGTRIVSLFFSYPSLEKKK